MAHNVDNDITVELNDYVATVEIHRPPNNFFDYELIRAIADAYERLDADDNCRVCLLYTSTSPRDKRQSRMPSSA